jgi:hypothetical protein
MELHPAEYAFSCREPRVTTQNAPQSPATPTVVREANLRNLEPLKVEEFPASSRARLPTQRTAVDGMFHAERLAGVHARFQNAQTHHIFYGIVQQERKEIGVEPKRKRTAKSWNSVLRSRCRAMISLT